MSKLGDIMGEEFEEKYEENSASNQEASKVEQATMMEICYEALNNEGFKGDEPRFRFSGESVNHDVLLMESPDENLDTFQWDLGDTAKTQGMFHMGNQLFSCAFQENMLDLLNKIEVGEYYVVVGQYQEKTEEQGDGTTETYYNINPVRGIVPLEVAKKYADKYEEQLESTSVEEQAQQQKSESSDADSGGIDIGGDDGDDTVDDSEILDLFQEAGKEALQSVSDGDKDTIDKVVTAVQDNTSGSVDRERILDLFEDEVAEIDGRGEEDDSGIDIGGSDDGDEEDDEPEETESSDDSSDGADEDEDPSDWF